MMENIRDPLIHIVRNAIDHGVEPLEDRVAAGKEITATIAVSARQSGNQIEIEIRDDGRGLSPAALVAKAIAAPLVTPTDARALGPKEQRERIFSTRFPTPAQNHATSGHGCGLGTMKDKHEK